MGTVVVWMWAGMGEVTAACCGVEKSERECECENNGDGDGDGEKGISLVDEMAAALDDSWITTISNSPSESSNPK